MRIAAFVMAAAEFLIVALNAPAHLGKDDGLSGVASQYLFGSQSPLGHSLSNDSSALGSSRRATRRFELGPT